MAGSFSPDAHWRDSARPARFFFIDYRASFPLLLYLLHIKWWTFFIAVFTMLFLGILERYGFTVTVFRRWLRSKLAGSRKIAQCWWRE